MARYATGMWHLDRGNRLKAPDYLIELICGTACKQYKDLRGELDGTVSY